MTSHSERTEQLVLRDLVCKLDRVDFALYGDPKQDGEGGLIHKVKKHEKKLELHEKLIWIGTGIAMAFEPIKKMFS